MPRPSEQLVGSNTGSGTESILCGRREQLTRVRCPFATKLITRNTKLTTKNAKLVTMNTKLIIAKNY